MPHGGLTAEGPDGADGVRARGRAAFVTFGCRLNKAEALDLESRYAASGWEIVPMSDAAAGRGPGPDLIVVRGCSVTAKAQRDCEKSVAHLRERFPRARIVETGCLRSAGADAAEAAAPGLPAAAPAERFRLSRAYLKVQDGCSGRCSFCIVPSFRGAPVSVPFRAALERARAFLAAGFREIVLVGCNLCLYRSEGRGLPELAAAMAELESPGHRVRLGSIEPGICDRGLVDAMEGHANICRFLHLSLQSGSDRILRLMRRPYDSESVRAFREEACRRLGPRLALGADVIAGFPGETDSDHEATKRLVSEGRPQRSPFVHLHVFPYSERPGTEAAAMAGAVPTGERRRRAREIEAIGLRNRAAFAGALVGETVAVCVERGGSGRTDEHLRCVLRGRAERRSIVCATVENYSLVDGSVSAIIAAETDRGGVRPGAGHCAAKGGAQS